MMIRNLKSFPEALQLIDAQPASLPLALVMGEA
jgi:hypothetical protein